MSCVLTLSAFAQFNGGFKRVPRVGVLAQILEFGLSNSGVEGMRSQLSQDKRPVLIGACLTR